MKLAVGSDHRGYALKERLLHALAAEGYICEDFGPHNPDAVDYPDIAEAVARAVAKGDFDHGILVCGTGIGMSITANKVPGVRAALCHDTFTAQRARQHTNANVLCMGAEELEVPAAWAIVKAYLETSFEGGRHQRRLDKVARLERGLASVSEAKGGYERASLPAAKDTPEDEALRFIRTAPHEEVHRSPEQIRRLLAIIEEIEAEAAREGTEGPTDVSENLDKYLYHF